MDSLEEPRAAVLWPLARRAVHRQDAAPRLSDLNGKTICELWDVIFRGEIIYPLVREYFRSRFPSTRFVQYSQFGNIYGPKERDVIASLPAKLREHGCDAVIAGIGA